MQRTERSACRIRESGFTLVELMVVVLIIGILVTIAVPVYTEAKVGAATKACQANQRTIIGAAQVMITQHVDVSSADDGIFAEGGSGWYDLMISDDPNVTGWLKTRPTCPQDGLSYYITQAGGITGDNGDDVGFKPDHSLE